MNPDKHVKWLLQLLKFHEVCSDEQLHVAAGLLVLFVQHRNNVRNGQDPDHGDVLSASHQTDGERTDGEVSDNARLAHGDAHLGTEHGCSNAN